MPTHIWSKPSQTGPIPLQPNPITPRKQGRLPASRPRHPAPTGVCGGGRLSVTSHDHNNITDLQQVSHATAAANADVVSFVIASHVGQSYAGNLGNRQWSCAPRKRKLNVVQKRNEKSAKVSYDDKDGRNVANFNFGRALTPENTETETLQHPHPAACKRPDISCYANIKAA